MAIFMSYKLSCLLQWTLLLLLVFLLHATAAKPYEMWSNYKLLVPQTETGCDTNSGILTLCQRCAKLTKSRYVYPMCCQDQESVRTWCDSYMSFGLQ